ncbi:MAG: DUF167 domain-containing protein [Phycisphaerales bacterium]|nr:MAG: DUF167 domain-containing protein [Phycisphaerales bacterium]
MHQPFTQPDPNDAGACLVRVKVVPGSKATVIVGRLGDRLKVKVAAPPEGGRANGAVCELIAKAVGVRSASVEVVHGATSPEKVLRVRGVIAAEAESRLGA